MHPDRKKIIADLTQWIELNLSAMLTIDAIAARSGYSKWHIQRMFREVNQVSIISYVRKRRLELAAADLVISGDTVAVVARRNGFSSEQAFSRSFIRWSNVAPGAWRNLARLEHSAGRHIFPSASPRCRCP